MEFKSKQLMSVVDILGIKESTATPTTLEAIAGLRMITTSSSRL